MNKSKIGNFLLIIALMLLLFSCGSVKKKQQKKEIHYELVTTLRDSLLITHFNTMALELQNKGYEQQGLPNISVDNNGITEISLMFRKLIYKAEYTQCGTLIRDYNFK